ncbi:MAG TPA: hydroxyacylglutathione hydrolase [Dokdonella sp.]|uniref:hydroxyacylglutathione hydrolase n=1 Tax=Dokdonella sp. TaxID=2291710 RepID=UPI002D1DBAAD|nr:hydroxyacylglutathione hydrolase [Dokdonella sp.]HUD42113.1 hydroxyacylglutathione hydrolase [Dokdonella sp.]
MHLLAVPAFADNYIWLLADAAGDAIAVDPGQAAPLRAALEREGLRLRAILLTHHHADHIGGVAELIAATPVPVYAPADARIACADHRVADGQMLTLSTPAVRFTVIAVPGHTRSHVAYAGEGLLFCGDTLFSLGCGRLFEGSPEQMLASLDRLAALPDATGVCCGHEYTLDNAAFAQTIEPGNRALEARIATVRRLRAEGRPSLPVSLGEERASNPFLRIDAPAVIAALSAEAGAGATRAERFGALRRRKDLFRAATA